MPFSHHSHSGQFCGHAKGTLEEMVQTAIGRKMKVFALTEHMPRHVEDFYPEEIEAHPDAESLARVTDLFYAEATRLRSKYQGQIVLPIGFETEWIRPQTLQLVRDLQSKYEFDMFVGSVHHVHTIPIDFDKTMYEDARAKSGGSDEQLFEDYFDAQYEMLRELKPPVVGHFDLIRLYSKDPNGSFQRWDGVWSRITRNLQFVADYQGLLELNSSALRKGMTEPYPKVEICKTFLTMGGRFVLSDDCHAAEQVGLNYNRVFESIEHAGITELYYCQPGDRTVEANSAVQYVPVIVSTIQGWS
ncbi:hypothetical protein FKW77_010306 [Venturia effusa]|uniref:Histidinol-phosphatase n=1 Tax=Venturia effusa TaxID=50376 RepID=A0A517L2D1_9PEZI|nr:hypothetical protein FKW77_010306 [Venturia effusa]